MGVDVRPHQGCGLQLHIEGGWWYISQHQRSIAQDSSKTQGEDVLDRSSTSQLQQHLLHCLLNWFYTVTRNKSFISGSVRTELHTESNESS